MQRKSIILIALILLSSCAPKESRVSGVQSRKAMVVAARKEAAVIGAEILKKGGNAFDAMVATELALAVAYPYAGNLGGGGFMVYRKANGDYGALDYREKAPMAAHRDMYLDSLGNPIPRMSLLGGTAIGVPGTVAGIIACHEKFGTLPLKDLVAPAIALARKGVVVTPKQQERLEKARELIIEVNGANTLFSNVFKSGDTIKYPALANTLEIIAEKGRAGFYEGQVAEKIVSLIQEKGGYITMEDLRTYRAVWRTPVTFSYRDLNIISMSPPSSGGVTLGQILKMIEPYPVKNYGHNSLKTVQLLTEAERRAYADRNTYLGDPDFVVNPTEQLLDPQYLKNRMATYRPDRATPSSQIGAGSVHMHESSETTHYSIVDAQGNAVSVTTTLNGGYGSKLYSDSLGFFFNNEMDDFSSKPGVPNMFGLLGSEANSIAPGKRMLSSMTPTIVERNGELYMVLGSPGGSTIITSVLQTILNVYEFEMSMQEAVAAGRFHHQHYPDHILMEPGRFSNQVKDSLSAMGYTLQEGLSVVIGKVDAILRLSDGTLEGGADPRGDDAAAGF